MPPPHRRPRPRLARRGGRGDQRRSLVAHHPREARRDRHDEHDRRGDDRVGARAAGLEPLPDRPSCMPISTKAKAFSTKTTVSHTAKIGTRMRAGMLPAPLARDRHRERHERQDAREAERLGRDPDAEGRGELHDRRVSARRAGRGSTGSSTNAQAMPAARLPKTVSRNTGATLAKPSGPATRRHDRDPIDEQGAGVVEQALALQDLQQPVGQLDLAHHGGGRRRVGRRDDRAEGDGDGPGHVRHQPVRRRARPPAPWCRPRR